MKTGFPKPLSFLSAAFLCCASTSLTLADETDTPLLNSSTADYQASLSQRNTEILNLYLDARVDYQRNWEDGKNIKNNSGFEGKYFDLRLDGCIIPGLNYSWRQRFNKKVIDDNFFDATDWIYLQYSHKNFSISAGKEVVAIGGWEYDRAPIDLTGCSIFWQNIPCYDLGVTVGYKVSPDDRLKFQVTQSPFFTEANRDMYSYNLMWESHHGIYRSLWSANMVEYADGKYISYLALGNRFDVDKFTLEFDFMNRAASRQTYFFRDCSVMGELSYRPDNHWRVFGKMTYDVNKTNTDADYTVKSGTEMTMVGGGVEYRPLVKKNSSLRLHATCYYYWGRNTITENVPQDKTCLLNVGLTWNMNLVNLKRK